METPNHTGLTHTVESSHEDGFKSAYAAPEVSYRWGFPVSLEVEDDDIACGCDSVSPAGTPYLGRMGYCRLSEFGM